MQEEQLKKLEDFKGKYQVMQRELEDKQRVIDDLQRAMANNASISNVSSNNTEAEHNKKLFKQLARAHQTIEEMKRIIEKADKKVSYEVF